MIILNFSGSVIVDDEAQMQYIGENQDMPQFISVKDWIGLNPEQQQNYILEDAITTIRDGEDLDFTELELYEGS